MNWSANAFINWLIAAWGVVLAWLYRSHDISIKDLSRQVAALETNRESKADADRQRDVLRREVHEFREETNEKLKSLHDDTNQKRDELRHDMQNFRAETGLRLETMRVETNTKLEKLSDQLTGMTMTRKRVK